MLSYGMGDSGTGLASSQFCFYLFPFFTCAAGLPPWIASSILMLIKLWDAINDPLIGWLSDHTQSRWGPRLPWMIGASLPLGIFLAAMWWIPNDYTIKEKTAYYICTSILFKFNFINITNERFSSSLFLVYSSFHCISGSNVICFVRKWY